MLNLNKIRLIGKDFFALLKYFFEYKTYYPKINRIAAFLSKKEGFVQCNTGCEY